MTSYSVRYAGLAALVVLGLAGCSAERPAPMARSDIYQSQSKPGASLAGSLKTRIARSYPQNGGVWENVGAGHDTLADAFTGWKSSPPHLRNMTEPRASRMGVAAVHAPGTRFEVFWAMVLADPNDPRVASSVGPAAPAAGATQADPPSGAQIAAQIPPFRTGAPGMIFLGR